MEVKGVELKRIEPWKSFSDCAAPGHGRSKRSRLPARAARATAPRHKYVTNFAESRLIWLTVD